MKRDMWNDYDHSDQEMDVYEQSCENCKNRHCPMMMPETAEEYFEAYGTLEGFNKKKSEEKGEAVSRLRKEDAIMHGGELSWCVHWRGRKGGRR